MRWSAIARSCLACEFLSHVFLIALNHLKSPRAVELSKCDGSFKKPATSTDYWINSPNKMKFPEHIIRTIGGQYTHPAYGSRFDVILKTFVYLKTHHHFVTHIDIWANRSTQRATATSLSSRDRMEEPHRFARKSIGGRSHRASSTTYMFSVATILHVAIWQS